MTDAGSVYGLALYDLAQSEDLSEQILKELDVLRRSFSQEPDFVKLLSTPALTKQERCNILDQSFRGKVQPYLLNFLKILTEKGYIRHFPHCCDAYRSFYNEDNGILVVKAVSAVALTSAQVEKLTEKLSATTGKTIDLQCSIDATALGGLRLNYDGKQVDGTVKTKLDAIGKLLKNTGL